MPLFALANAGVAFNFSSDANFSLSTNLAISLVAGNSIGIFLFSFLAIKFNIAELPENVSFQQLAGVSFLGGLGFTMSLFINNLAYTEPSLINSAKMGILIGSFAAGLTGYLILRFTLRGKKEEAPV
jgi:NhaA family Na+:H+ antiporter